MKKLLIALLLLTPALTFAQSTTTLPTPTTAYTPQFRYYGGSADSLKQIWVYSGGKYNRWYTATEIVKLFGRSFNQKIDSIKAANNTWTGINIFSQVRFLPQGSNNQEMRFLNDNGTYSSLFYYGSSTPYTGVWEFQGQSLGSKNLNAISTGAKITVGDNANNNVGITAAGVTGSYTQTLQAKNGTIALVGSAGTDTSVTNNYQSKIWKNVKTDGGAKGDSTVNENQYIQPLLNSGGNIYFPAGRYIINGALNIKSNTNLFFHKDAVLIQRPTANDKTYSVLRIDSVKNVSIQGGTIIGDKYRHIGTGGEHGNGLSIYSSDSVTVRDLRVSKTWGDGVYVGKDTLLSTKPSRAIYLENVHVFDARRNGISVTTVDGLQIIGGSVNKVDGTEPQSGIDLEPNAGDKVKNVVITGVKIFNTVKVGLLVYKSNLTDTLYNIRVNNCVFSNTGAEGLRILGSTNSIYYGNKFDNNGSLANNTYAAINVENWSLNNQFIGNEVVVGTLNTNKIRHSLRWLSGANNNYAIGNNLNGGALSGDVADAGTSNNYAINYDPTVNNTLYKLGLATAYTGSANDPTLYATPGFYPKNIASTATNYPAAGGYSQLGVRTAGSMVASFENFRSTLGDSTLYFRVGTGTSTVSPWMAYASKSYVGTTVTNAINTNNGTINRLNPGGAYTGDANAAARYATAGFSSYVTTTGATNFPTTAGSGWIDVRSGGSTNGAMEKYTSNVGDGKTYERKGDGTGTGWTAWQEVVYGTTSQTVNNKIFAPLNTYQSSTGTTSDSLRFASSQRMVEKALVAGSGIGITQTASTVTIAAQSNVVEITGTSQTAVANTIYIPHNAALTTITVPTTTTIGSLYQVIGEGAGGWKLQLPAGYTAVGVGSFTTTSGGSLNSTDRNCTITIRLTNTNKFTVTTSQGTINPL